MLEASRTKTELQARVVAHSAAQSVQDAGSECVATTDAVDNRHQFEGRRHVYVAGARQHDRRQCMVIDIALRADRRAQAPEPREG